MNLIQLFQNKNNRGKTFKRGDSSCSMRLYENVCMREHSQIRMMEEEDFLADDWEVVREKKTKSVELISNQGFPAATESICIPRGIPPNTVLKVTFEWEE